MDPKTLDMWACVRRPAQRPATTPAGIAVFTGDEVLLMFTLAFRAS